MDVFWLTVFLFIGAVSASSRNRRTPPYVFLGYPPSPIFQGDVYQPRYPYYPHRPPFHPPKPYGSAICRLVAANNSMVAGELSLDQESSLGPVSIIGEVVGLTPGRHGFHIHEMGDTGDDCNAAGPHFNPTNKKHGAPDSAQRHVGDLGNIVAAANGVALLQLLDSEISLVDGNPRSVLGRAIVVHAMEDDLGRGGDDSSEATGNAGARLACCVIEAPKFYF